MDEIELNREDNTFVLRELFFDGLQYYTKHGTIVKNIIPRKVTTVDESNSGISGLHNEPLSVPDEETGMGSSEISTEY